MWWRFALSPNNKATELGVVTRSDLRASLKSSMAASVGTSVHHREQARARQWIALGPVSRTAIPVRPTSRCSQPRLPRFCSARTQHIERSPLNGATTLTFTITNTNQSRKAPPLPSSSRSASRSIAVGVCVCCRGSISTPTQRGPQRSQAQPVCLCGSVRAPVGRFKSRPSTDSCYLMPTP